MLAKDTENKPVNYEPAILPEEAEEALRAEQVAGATRGDHQRVEERDFGGEPRPDFQVQVEEALQVAAAAQTSRGRKICGAFLQLK